MTQIANINKVQTMTSLEIAELTGKQHFHVMEAIRKMEPAWKKVAESNFRLGSYKDANGQMRPCYQLTKTECLYIATKFNDEARAKLVLRWEELEKRNLPRPSEGGEWLAQSGTEGTPLLWRGQERRILALADEIIGEGLRMLNEPAEDTLTATQVAKTFNMTVWDFNQVLSNMGIQYRRYGRWNISVDLEDRDLVRMRTHVSYSLKGEKKVRHYMTWTMAGLRYLNSKLGYPNF
ncbi:MAG: Rha family transcriptional regulator [Prevotella sp.]|nr:Rha family transcriptional regulator [Prevotella sp.]